MKTTLPLFHTAIRSLALLAVSILAPFLEAQVFIGSDYFDDNTLTLLYAINNSSPQSTQAAGQWRGGTTGTGAAWTETNQRMEFTTDTAAPADSGLSGYLTWITPGLGTNAVGNVGLPTGNPYTSSWVAQVDATALTAGVSTGYLNAGLLLYSMTPTVTNAKYALYLAGGATGTKNVVLQIDTLNAGGTYDTTQASSVTSDTTDVTLRLSYDGTTHLLTPSYSLDGATYINFSSYDLAGAYGGTTIPPNYNGFGLQLYGGAANGAGPVTSGMITFDNLSVSAIPEPSTYAALAGLACLVVAIGRRRAARGLATLRRRRAA